MFYAAVANCSRKRGARHPSHYLIASDDPISTAVRLSLERDEDLQMVMIVGSFGSLEDSEEFCERLRTAHKQLRCFKKAVFQCAKKLNVDIVDMSK